MLGSCPRSSNGRFSGLMRAKVVHTCLDCSVFLAGKSCSWHGGNLDSEQEREAALTFIVRLQNAQPKDKIKKHFNEPKM